MKTIRRFRELFVATLAAGAVVSCDDATRPKTEGEIAPNILVAEVRPNILARLVTPTNVFVQVNGPSVDRLVPLTLKGGNWEGRINVAPNTYELLIVAYANNEIQFYGRIPAVTVARGQRVEPTIPIAAAIPEAEIPPLNNTTSFSQQITFSRVLGATGYTLQLSPSSTFPALGLITVPIASPTDTAPVVNVDSTGAWFVRVRATVPMTGVNAGDVPIIPTVPWSNTQSWTVLQASGGDTPGSATAVPVTPGDAETVTNRNITPTKTFDWFDLPVVAGDSIFIETFAARIPSTTTTFPSALDTRISLYRANGTDLIDFHDNIDSPASTDSRLVRVAAHTETYKIRVEASPTAAANATTGHYELRAEIRRLPLAPSALTATIVSGTQVDLTWTDNANNETGFQIDRCTGPTCTNWTMVGSTLTGTTNASMTGLTQGDTYRFRVRAVNVFGTSLGSNIVTTVLDGPAAPSSLTATSVSATRINLTWTDNANNETGFNVERCTGVTCTNFAAIGTVQPVNTVAFTDSTVVYGQSYRYQVRATNSVVPSAYTSIADANTNPPAAPTSLEAAVSGPTSIDLNWDDNADNEVGFEIQRCLVSGCTFAIVDTVAANAESFTDTTVANNQDYRYRIRAFHHILSLTFSDTANADTRPPTAPTALTATTQSATSIALAWTDNADDETGYSVQRCHGVGCSLFTTIHSAAPGATGYTDNTPKVDSTYSYRIIATGIAGPSNPSNTATANTLRPAAPSSLVATTVTADTISLAWLDNANNETGFTVQRCEGVACSGFTTHGTAPANATSYKDTTVNAGVSYSYQVRANNIAGSSAFSSTATANTFAPAAPTSLTSSTVSGSRIDLAWTNNAPEAVTMRIERCTGVACADFEEIDVVPAAQTTYQNIGGSFPVVIDSTYTYRVRAQNAADVSTYSNTSTSNTIQPSMPASLTATTNSATQITLAWTGSTPGITGYEVQRCDFAGCANFAFLSGTDAATLTIPDATVTAGNDYVYRVRGVNIIGPGPFSPLATANTRTPTAPSALTATVLVNLVRLDWSDNSDNEQIFVIERCAGAACSPSDYQTISTAGIETWDDSTVSANTEYTYRVRAENASGASSPSGDATANTLIAAQIVTLNAGAVSPTQINLSWTPSADQGTGLITGHRVYRCDGACNPATTGTLIASLANNATTYNDTSVTADNDYTYAVIPLTAFGATAIAGSGTAYASTAVPSAPTGLTGAALSTTSVELNWNDNASNETGYTIAQCDGVGCTSFTEIATLGADAVQHTVAGLTFGQRYRFLVRAFNTAGSSAWTDTVEAGPTVPAAPTGFDVFVTSGSGTLTGSWTDVANDETQYEVDFCAGPGCTDWAVSNTEPAGATVANLGDLAATVWRFRVRAVNLAGTSTESNIVEITGGAPYSAPTGTIATTLSSTSIGLTWSDNTDNETTFNVWRCTGVGCDPFTGSQVTTEARNTTSWVDNSVAFGAIYRYLVVASNGAGEIASAAFEGHTMTASAPTALNATALSNTQIFLTWTDNGPFETAFVVERCSGPGCSSFVAIDTVPANFISYNDIGLSPNVTYRYRVVGINAVAPSAYSNTAEKATDLPATPASLVALAMTSTRIDLTWDDLATNEDFYIVERCAGTCDENGVFTEIETGLAPNAEAFSDVSVSASQTYSYRVRALNSGGVSPYTNIATAVTAVPIGPSDLVVTTLAGTLIQLTWTDLATNELTYQVERCTVAACPTFTLRKTLAAGSTSYVDTVDVDDAYTYRIRALNNVGASSYSTEESANTYLAAVASNFVVGTVSATRIDLSWTDNASNEDGYIVERCSGPGCSDFTTHASLGADATGFQDDGIATQTSFTYRIYPYNIAGNSAFVGPLTATTITPAAPSGLAAILAAPGQIDLSWVDNADNEIVYRIERCSAGTTKCATADSMNVYAVEVATLPSGTVNHSDVGLAGSTLYFYRVRATNVAGTSAYSSIVSRSTSVPPAPTGPDAQTRLATRIDLTWSDASANEEGFRVERCIGPDPCNTFTQIAQLPAGTTFHADSTLTWGQTVWYRILSYNGGGGNASSVVSATTIVPDAPQNVLAQAVGQDTVALTWNDVAVDEAGFYLERCEGLGCTNFVVIDTLPVDATTYSDPTVVSGNVYSYRLTAFGNGRSDFTPPVSAATVVPNAVTGLVATPISNTRIDLAWVDNTPADSLWNEQVFSIYRCDTAVDCVPAFYTTVGSGVTVYSDASLTPGVTYRYLVRAGNFAGEGVPSDTVSAATTVPAIPTVLTDSTLSATEVILSWIDNADNEDGYEIERCEGLGCSNYAAVDTAAADGQSIIMDGLIGGTTYQFRIRAFNATGSSGYSNEVSAQSDVPQGPTGLIGATISGTQVQIQWSENAPNETAYIIERCDGTGCSGFAVIDSLSADVSIYQDATIAIDTAYVYRVRASNAAGASVYSNEFLVSTYRPETPINLVATPISATRVDLTWTDVAVNDTAIIVQRCSGALCSGFVDIDTLPPTAVAYSDETVTVNNTYNYRLRAENAAGSSAPSDSAEVGTFIPSDPSSVTATTMSPTMIQVDWDDNSNTEIDFLIERCVGIGCSSFDSLAVVGEDATGYLDNSTSLGNSYTYRVIARGGGGNSAPSNEGTAHTFPAGAVSTLTAAPLSSTTLQLSWSAADFVNQYQISTVDGVDTTLVGFVSAGVSDTVVTVTTGFVYQFVIQANNNAGAGDYASTTIAMTPPPAPVGLEVYPLSTNQASLTWGDTTNRETNYEVERSFFSAGVFGPYSTVATLGADATAHVNTVAVPTGRYKYRVRATNVIGAGDYSNEVDLTLTGPAAPTALSSFIVAPGQIQLNWTDNSNSEQLFSIERSVGNNVSWAQIATVGADVTGYLDASGISINTTYYYRVRAINNIAASAFTNETNTTTTVPATVISIGSVIQSSTSIQVAWNGSGTVGEDGFRVYRCVGGGCTDFTLLDGTLPADANTYLDTAATYGTIYRYQARPYNIAGEPVGNPLNERFLVLPTPSAVQALPVTRTSTRVRWNATPFTWETGFEVEQCQGSGCVSFSPLATLAPNDSMTVSASLTGNGTHYRYRVRAIADGNAGPWSPIAITHTPFEITLGDTLISTTAELLPMQNMTHYVVTMPAGSPRVEFTIGDGPGGVTSSGGSYLIVSQSKAIERPAINVYNQPSSDTLCTAGVFITAPNTGGCSMPQLGAPTDYFITTYSNPYTNLYVTALPGPTLYTFNNCTQTGRLGPSQAQCNAAYTGTSLAGQVVVVDSGAQNWTVPFSGRWAVTATGAAGASATPGFAGGRGARIYGEFNLTQGQVLKLAVGQMGSGAASNANGGGGGGSFVYNLTGAEAMLIAGGGAGTRGGALQNGCDASISVFAGTGSASSSTWPCTLKGGSAGLGGIISSVSWGSAGAGFDSNGQDDSGYGTGGRGWVGLLTGGADVGFCGSGFGGFGGGGSGGGCNGGGGGGGYSGGDGGWIAGGGGSFNLGTNPQATAGVGTGHGVITLKYLGPI